MSGSKATPFKRNPELIPGVERYSRSEALKRKLNPKKFAAKAKAKAAKKPAKTEAKKEAKKPGKFVVDAPRKLVPRHHKPKPAKLRPNIVPGTVLILLAGRYRGKRVVFLTQLPSGLLLVTGPMALNGVPLRRVNQAYVIATSTTVDVSDLKFPENGINDGWFTKTKARKAPKSADDLLGEKKEEKKAVPEARKESQKLVDNSILPAIKKIPLLEAYLKSTFTLRRGQYPHAMKF